MQILGFADDTTGALEVGVHFLRAGYSSLVALREVALDFGPGSVVSDTATRHAHPERAKQIVQSFGEEARNAGLRLLFKKTDSTLRGNIAAELAGLLSAFPDRVVVYAPAYPALGRTVAGGHLFVHGRPVHLTEFANDVRRGVQESHIPTMLQRRPELRVAHVADLDNLEQLLRQPGNCNVILCDAETEQQQSQIAGLCAERPEQSILAGPGSLGGYWALQLPASVARNGSAPWPPQAMRVLVLNGSQHPVSLRQIDAVKQFGVAVFHLRHGSGPSLSIAGGATYALQEQGLAVICCGRDLVSDPFLPVLELAAMAKAVISQAPVDAIMVFGGDSTRGLLEALGVGYVEPVVELLPGVPASLFEYENRHLWLISKAGGFGEEDVIYQAMVALRGG